MLIAASLRKTRIVPPGDTPQLGSRGGAPRARRWPSIPPNPAAEMTARRLRQVRAKRKKDRQVLYSLPTPPSRPPVLRSPQASPPRVSLTVARRQPQRWELRMHKPPRRRKSRFRDVLGFEKPWRAGAPRPGLELRLTPSRPPPPRPRTRTRPRPREGPELRECAAAAGRAGSLGSAAGAGRAGLGGARGCEHAGGRRARGERAPRAPRTPETELYYLAPSRASLLAGHSNSFPTSAAEDFSLS